MLTYQLFLGHNDQARLEFYQQYVDLPREYQTAEAVAKLRRVSSTSVYRMIQIISDELNELRGARGLKYVPTSAPILKKFNIPAPAYAVYLMRKSLVGQFMLAVVQHPEWTVKDFAVAQNTSTATVSRRLKNMSAFLRRFDLRLAFNPIGLCGNEMVARVALSEILWQICQDGTQLFPELGDLPEESATRIEAAKLVMPNFAHSRLQVICAVNIIRANQHHELPAMRPLEEVLTVTGSKELAGHIPALGHELPNTMALIHLQSMLGAGFHVPQEPLLARFIGYHARMNTAEWQLVTLVIKRVKAVAGIDEHQLEDQVLIANLLSITVAMNLLGQSVPVFEPVIVAAGSKTPVSLQKAVQQVFATLPGHLQSFRRIQTALMTRILPLLATAMPDALEKVRVYIDNTMDHQIYTAVASSLALMPAVHMVKTPDIARLIVTADLTKAFVPLTPQANFFYFPISSYSAWLRLEHYIHYLAVHELGIRTGSGINYTYVDVGLPLAAEE